MTEAGKEGHQTPLRFEHLNIIGFLTYVGVLAVFIWSFESVGMSLTEFVSGIPNMARLLDEMTPPSLERIGSVSEAILVTFQMGLVGAVFGIFFSFFLSILAARNLSPHPVFYFISRGMIALFRSIPDLIWAVFFVATVGLGPFAGTLAIIIDTMGFCGRFFAEAMEEVDSGPQEALSAIGASKLGIIFSAVVPAAMPSFINSALFSLEKAIRSSVVLGLVGAGGIGIELKVAMDMFLFAEAATIMMLIFVLVMVVEQASIRIRRRFI